MSGLVPKYTQQVKREKRVVLLGKDLQDAREELFTRMVCDGVPMGTAFAKAGFTSRDRNAPSNLWHVQRVQERANAILEARATQGVVTLPQVTDMLQRVFSGALHEGEFSAAHNAAFSLARVYGHVTDRNVLEVIRRPSRDPDAPSETALADWVAGLPALNASPASPASHASPASPASPDQGQGPSEPCDLGQGPSLAPLPGPGARLLGEGPQGPQGDLPSVFNGLDDLRPGPLFAAGPSGLEAQARKPNEINGLAGARPENGAPTSPVTVTHHPCERTDLLRPGPDELRYGVGEEGTRPPGGSRKGAPSPERQVPVPKKGGIKRYGLKGPKGPKPPSAATRAKKVKKRQLRQPGERAIRYPKAEDLF